jgi:hypothetical protein
MNSMMYSFSPMEWMSKAEAFDGAVYLQVIALSKSLVFRTHKFFTRQEDVDDYSQKHSPGGFDYG